jgi:hypothetical protein
MASTIVVKSESASIGDNLPPICVKSVEVWKPIMPGRVARISLRGKPLCRL